MKKIVHKLLMPCLMLLGLSAEVFAQCPITVTAPPDQSVCSPGETVFLPASVSPDPVNVIWTPAFGLDNPFSLTPTATVSTNITYTVTVSAIDPGAPNFWQNGDFSQGLANYFGSNYDPPSGGDNGPLTEAGELVVTDDPPSQNVDFADYNDFTGDGNMLLVNGSSTPGDNVVCQDIPIQPNTGYYLGGYVASAVATDPAFPRWFVNGDLVINQQAPGNPGQWVLFAGTWVSGPVATTATVCISNSNTEGAGNDFSLDGLFFSPLCEVSDQVTLSVADLAAEWSPPTGLCSGGLPVFLDDFLEPTSTLGGTWTINGDEGFFLFDPTFWGEGANVVTYTVQEFPCEESFTDTIFVDPLPAADWTPPDELCELNDPFPLDDLLDEDTEEGGFWRLDGQPITDFDPGDLGPGEYIINYTAGEGFCINDFLDTIVVEAAPIANWTPPAPICQDGEFFILDSLLDDSATVGGFWELEGNTLDTLNPADYPPGRYELIYTTGPDYCPVSYADTLDFAESPDVGWAAPTVLCEEDNSFDLNTLLGTAATPGGIWVVNGDTTDQFDPVALGPGSYPVSYTAVNDGCALTDEQTLTVDPLPVSSFTVTPDSLCLGDEATLTFDGTASGSATYNWDFGGLSANPGTGPGPHQLSATASGSYTVSLWLEDNGCVSDTFSLPVVFFEPVDAPQPFCGFTNNSSITVDWADVPGASGYSVEVVSGQPGGTLVGSSFVLDGLLPDEEVEFIVTALSDSPCPDAASDTLNCTTLACTPPVVFIDPVAPICFDSVLMPIDLSVQLSEPGGTGAWSGPGIINTVDGVFDPVTAGVGTHIIAYDYTVNNCTGQDTVAIEVIAIPEGTFDLPDEICVTDTAAIIYTGDAAADAEFVWNFDGGVSQNDPADPQQLVSWATPGDKTVSLVINPQGCASKLEENTITVSALLQPPVVNCAPTDSSVTFIWADNPAVDSFVVLSSSPAGGMMMSDTSFRIGGMMPGEAANIEIQAFSASSCPDTVFTGSCIAEDCPDVSLSIDLVPDICLTAGSPLVNLQGSVDSGPNTGTLTWSGPGVSGSTFDPNTAGVGTHTITLSYALGNCGYSESITINVFATPVASFTLPDTLCLSSGVTVLFDGSAGASAAYDYDFAGADILSGTGAGPYSLQWDTPGTYTLSLSITENGCVSELFERTVEVEDTLTAPDISCTEATYTSVLFTWSAVENADAYTVTGAAGTVLSDTSYLVENLNPGESATITVTAVSGNACPDVSASASCAALECPDVQLSLTPPADQCFDGTPDTLAFDFGVQNGTGNGTLSWSGAGIFDPAQGLWAVDGSQIGQPNPVILTWTESVCTVSDTVFLNVFATPTADFTASGLICVSDTAAVNFSGSVSGNSPAYDWDFDGATVLNGSEAGPYELQWPAAGTYELSLVVTENGCTSDTFRQTTVVDPLLEAPVINCTASTSSVLFTWNAVANASAYDITGAAGSLTSDTSYLVSNLMPGEAVSVTVTALSANACPSVSSTADCAAELCADVEISIVPPGDQCFDGTAQTLDLEYALSNGTGGGTVVWSGAGITDPVEGLWELSAAQIGQPNEVIVLWAESVCSVADTITFNVFETPEAAFSAPAVVCESDTVSLSFTGSVSGGNADYGWSFDGATVVSGSAEGPYELQWAAGTYEITLAVTENGCVSDTARQALTVDEVLEAPQIACNPTTSSILFSWNTVENADSYTVSGAAGMMQSDTSYLVEGLMPGEEVSITVVAESSNACPSVSADFSCAALFCPPVEVSILPPADQCFDGNPQVVNLSFDLNNGTGNGTLSWSGTGIADPANGQWTTAAAQIGQANEIVLTWTEDNCSVSDTALINVFAQPVAGLSVDQPVCESDTSVVSFTGTVGSATVDYDWDFGAATVISGTGSGPYELSWPGAGDYPVSLTVTENGCVSAPAEQTVTVDPALAPPQISCESTTTSVTFSWEEVPNASGYDITGAAGTQLSATEFRVDGLLPEEEASITVVALSSNACPDAIASLSCAASACPDLSVSLSATETICEGEEAMLQVTFSDPSAGPFTFTFTANGDPQTVTDVSGSFSTSLPLSATTTFELTEVLNQSLAPCVPELPAAVTTEVSPAAEAGMPLDAPRYCPEDTEEVDLFSLLEGAQAGGSWSQSAGPAARPGSFDAANGSFTVNQQASGTYTFTYTVAGIAPCPSDEATVEIIIETPPVADAGTDLSLDCATTSGIIGGSQSSSGPGITYSWGSLNGNPVPDPTAATVTVSEPGTYVLLVSDANTGCTAQDTVLVNTSVSFPELFATASPVVCNGDGNGAIVVDSVSGGQPPFLYALNGDPLSSDLSFTDLPAGSYTLLMEDALGCQDSISLAVEEPAPLSLTLTATPDREEIALGESLTLNALVSPADAWETLIWSPDSLACDSCLSVTLTPTESFSYSLTVIDENGCTATAGGRVFVTRDRAVYFPNVFSPNEDGANDTFLPYGGPEVERFESFAIFNRWGEQVYSLNGFAPGDPVEGWDGTFRGEEMNPGVFVYYAEVRMVDGVTVIFEGDLVLMR